MGVQFAANPFDQSNLDDALSSMWSEEDDSEMDDGDDGATSSGALRPPSP